jgi:hypothetical protein
MNLQEKIKRAKELNDALDNQKNLPSPDRMDDKEWQVVVRELNCLDKQIEAEESIEKGEWKKDPRIAERLRSETKTNRYAI